MSDANSSEVSNEPLPTSFGRCARRVLGVLIEKGFTTPDQYPLTLKAATSGCNQKNNRDPVTNYPEEAIEEALDELRGMGLVATVHTDGGRTERFRHYVRKRIAISEEQLAILGELLLRGRQQVGELRARASRMYAIESLEDLRRELKGMQDQGWIQTNGPLDRRGVELDHTFYEETENRRMTYQEEGPVERTSSPAPAAAPSAVAPAPRSGDVESLKDRIADLESRLAEVEDQLARLRSSLGA